MTRRSRGGVVLGALMLAAPAARAWNDQGHMMVAAIAYRRLTPEIRARTATLVRLHPDYPRWIAGVSAPDRDQVAFLRASTWADAIKHDPRYANERDLPAAAAAAARRETGYQDRLTHRDWHYVDLPFIDLPSGTVGIPSGTGGIRVGRTPVPNAETQLAALRKTLATPDAPDPLKSYDLVWLIHLVGDVHQPLHCISRFDRAEPRGDRGGNTVRICAPPCTDALHGFWDAVAGTSEDPAEARTQAATLAPADPALAALTDATKWIAESFAAARQSVYITPIGPGDGPFTLDTRYRGQARRVALQRIALAGARLASVINAELR